MENALKKISTKEERVQAVSDLESNVAKLEWISNSPNPLKEIKAELDDCVSKLDDDKLSSEELRNIWAKIQELRITYSSINDGSYIPNLRRNVTAVLLAVEQYDANLEDRNFFDILKGIISGDDSTKEYLQKKYLFSIASITGDVPGMIDMRLETMKDILKDIRNSNLVGIEIIEEAETALIPVAETQSSISKMANEMTNKFLAERGIKEENVTQTNTRDLETAIDDVDIGINDANNKKAKKRREDNLEPKARNDLEIDE